MRVFTYIYHDFWGTDNMRRSVNAVGYDIEIVRTNDNIADVLRNLYFAYRDSREETILYADAADSYFLSQVEVPTDRIIYQTEKACFPHPQLADQFPSESRWKYLNGGGYCGNRGLIVEFFERYGINDIGNINAQAAQQMGYLQAVKDGFPIELDTECKIFQSIAFSEPGEFIIVDGKVNNYLTGTIPGIIHGNGRTEMDWVYKL
jgi:hypothetical protein